MGASDTALVRDASNQMRAAYREEFIPSSWTLEYLAETDDPEAADNSALDAEEIPRARGVVPRRLVLDGERA